MKQSVIDAWHQFSEPLEGRVYHMYLDVLGLVTAGVGNLADPQSLALAMPWKRKDGTYAAPHEVSMDWARVKSLQEFKTRHYSAVAPFSTVRLDDEGVDRMVRHRLLDNEKLLRAKYFPDWDHWSADAQLGVMSMAWAVGAGFPVKFPRFAAYAREQKWLEAMTACTIREAGNPGVVPRNRANRLCFANAETVRRNGMPAEPLHWPNEAPAGPATPTLRRNSTYRDAVERWQSILADTIPGVRVDGRFGPHTEAATKQWQAARQLTADGVVGRLTWRAAEAEYAQREDDPVSVLDPEGDTAPGVPAAKRNDGQA